MTKQRLGREWGCRLPALPLLVGTLTILLSGCSTPDDGHHHYHPEVSIPDGHVQAFRLFAEGVQIYTWTGTNWSLPAPEAELYDLNHNHAGKHYKGSGGPTWEGTDGSKVVGRVEMKADAYKSNSIPHLRLIAVSSSKTGAFSHITYIQRVDTLGGIAPAAPGKTLGQEERVRYTAEYVFYRKKE